jgi:hypothetical protein
MAVGDTIAGSEPVRAIGDVARIALVTGITAILAAVALVLLFTVDGAFGRVNDVLNAAIGVLSALLALVVLRSVGGSVPLVGLAVIGAAITVVGSWLVISGATGFQLAGFVSGVGFALIGAWLVSATAAGPLGALLSPAQARLGLVAGGLMLAGIIGIAGVAMGIDTAEATPSWLWLYGIGWLGTYVAYPAWCLMVARAG